jgi:hypothetical protein
MVFSFFSLLLAGADVYSVVDPLVPGAHVLAGTHALASIYSFCCCWLCCCTIAGALALVMLQHDILSFFSAPMQEKSSVPFTFPHVGKFWSLEPGQVSLQRPDFYDMEECKMSQSGDWKTFPAFGNSKGLLPGTQGVF